MITRIPSIPDGTSWARVRRIGLLPRRNPDRAIDPLGLVDRPQPAVQFPVPPPLETDQIAMTTRRDHLQIILSDHASIADEDQPVEPEPPVQVGHDLLDRGVVDLVARPDVMRDRPARDHHHRDNHLDVLRLAIPAVAVLGEIGRPSALKVGAGDVVEH